MSETTLRVQEEENAPLPRPPRYVSEYHMEPRCVPTGYGSTVLFRKDSTWRRFVEEVTFQKCLVPVRSVSSQRTPPCVPPPPPPPPPRRYRAELEVWISGQRPEGRQPIVLPVQASA